MNGSAAPGDEWEKPGKLRCVGTEGSSLALERRTR
jgi:hypothetical protein